MHRLTETLAILADGEFHSGEELAQILCVSRGTVWKQIEQVRQNGLDVYAVRGRGYRLSRPFEMLDQNAIMARLDSRCKLPASLLDIRWCVDSTNSVALEQARHGKASGYTCVAELQSGGRGRRGRAWQSPLGGNICLSQLWKISDGMSSLGCLSLAVAVAIVRALKKEGVSEVGVKWPNDIIANGKKLAGILLEIAGEPTGPCHVVIGTGINVHISDSAAQHIDQPWAEISALTDQPISRNALVARLMSELWMLYQKVETQSAANYLDEWRALDCYLGKPVTVYSARGEHQGIVRGVDDGGALEIESDGALLRFHSGEVSLRSS